MTAVTFSRKHTPLWVLRDGARIGEILRFTHPRPGREIGLFLNGVYWRDGEPNTRGGQAGTGFPTVRQARARALEVAHLATPVPVPAQFHVELEPEGAPSRSHPDGIAEKVGARYGRLVVLERAPSDPKLRGVRYKCRCDCGTEVVRLAYNLRQGAVVSCGCAKLNPGPRKRRSA